MDPSAGHDIQARDSQVFTMVWQGLPVMIHASDPVNPDFMLAVIDLGHLPPASGGDIRMRAIEMILQYNNRVTGQFALEADGRVSYTFALPRQDGLRQSMERAIEIRLIALTSMIASLVENLRAL